MSNHKPTSFAYDYNLSCQVPTLKNLCLLYLVPRRLLTCSNLNNREEHESGSVIFCPFKMSGTVDKFFGRFSIKGPSPYRQDMILLYPFFQTHLFQINLFLHPSIHSLDYLLIYPFIHSTSICQVPALFALRDSSHPVLSLTFFPTQTSESTSKILKLFIIISCAHDNFLIPFVD